MINNNTYTKGEQRKTQDKMNRIDRLHISSKTGKVSESSGREQPWLLYGTLMTRLKSSRQATPNSLAALLLRDHNSQPWAKGFKLLYSTC